MLTNKVKMIAAIALASCLMACAGGSNTAQTLEEAQKRTLQACQGNNVTYQVSYIVGGLIIEANVNGVYNKKTVYDGSQGAQSVPKISVQTLDGLYEIESTQSPDVLLLDGAKLKLNGVEQTSALFCQSYLL
jgi:hypothetical protein